MTKELRAVTQSPVVPMSRHVEPGVERLSFCSPVSDMLSVWEMCGDSRTLLTETEEVSLTFISLIVNKIKNSDNMPKLHCGTVVYLPCTISLVLGLLRSRSFLLLTQIITSWLLHYVLMRIMIRMTYVTTSSPNPTKYFLLAQKSKG